MLAAKGQGNCDHTKRIFDHNSIILTGLLSIAGWFGEAVQPRASNSSFQIIPFMNYLLLSMDSKGLSDTLGVL